MMRQTRVSGNALQRCLGSSDVSDGMQPNAMKPAAFEYNSPDHIDEVLEFLAEHGDEARVLAGG